MSYVEVDTPNPQFKKLYSLPPDINLVICIGGRGGMKSYEISKFAAYSSCIKKKRCVVLRDEKEKIRESILNEIFNRYDTANQHGHLDQFYSKLDTGIRDKKTGDMLVFTQGFRASTKEKRSNLKGVSDIDIAIVEEAEDVRSFEKFNTFKDSMRKQGRLIIVMLNTPDVNHWVVKKYFDLKIVEDGNGAGTGYFELVPKKINGFMAIQTNFKDNPFLPADVVRDYEGYGDPESHLYDMHYYMTQILGYASSGRRGQILTKVKKISLQDYIALPYREIYGLDFGDPSPAGLVGVKMHRNTIWARELNYKPMDTLQIGIKLCDLQFTQQDLIIADSAGRLDIAKLLSGWPASELTPDQAQRYPQLMKGFNVLGAMKPPGSIASGLRTLKSMEMYVTDDSENYWHEIQNYIYAVDRNDNPTDEPTDDFNHLIDPTRYVVTARGIFF